MGDLFGMSKSAEEEQSALVWLTKEIKNNEYEKFLKKYNLNVWIRRRRNTKR